MDVRRTARHVGWVLLILALGAPLCRAAPQVSGVAGASLLPG
jgi:hypothetical protein